MKMCLIVYALVPLQRYKELGGFPNFKSLALQRLIHGYAAIHNVCSSSICSKNSFHNSERKWHERAPKIQKLDAVL
uniref:Uncharacterized protein n=1 Tax=Anguilla anguilla TaxID=7936 RepID=A0A0E9V870_ANGAN